MALQQVVEENHGDTGRRQIPEYEHECLIAASLQTNIGWQTLTFHRPSGKQRNGDHGLISGGVAREGWTIHPDDPLSARGWCHWTTEMERDDIRLRTETFSEMWSDSEAFHLTARLQAFENDAMILERELTDSIPRDHL